MDRERLFHTLKLCTLRTAIQRGDYLRKKEVFAFVGENCEYMPRKVPLYAKLIKLGRNVNISSGVSIITHDGTLFALNAASQFMPLEKKHSFKETIGCVEIGDNVFVGANAMICANVHIGNNVIITSGSIVVSDIPSNSVVQGNPARKVCSFEQYYELRAAKESYPDEFSHSMGGKMEEKLAEWLWNDFYKSRGMKE